MRKPLWLVILLAIVVSGCAPKGDPEPTVFPTGTIDGPTAPASSSSSPTPSSDPLFEEAERVFRAYWAETEKLDRQGGADKLPPVFSKYLAGDYYAGTEELYRLVKKKGYRTEPGNATKISKIGLDNGKYEDSLINIQVCTDSRKVTFTGPNGEKPVGGLHHHKLYLKRFGNDLKIFAGGNKAVEKCPF